jgi:phospholipase C
MSGARRFIEARFADDYPGLIETNITPWRRAVAGDLTTAFDFATANALPVSLPSTRSYLPPDQERHPDLELFLCVNQALPHQEPGVRPARALP